MEEIWVEAHPQDVYKRQDLDRKRVKPFQQDMLAFFDREHPEVARELTETGELSPELTQKIVEAAREFRGRSEG